MVDKGGKLCWTTHIYAPFGLFFELLGGINLKTASIANFNLWNLVRQFLFLRGEV